MDLKEERLPFEGNLSVQVRKDQDVSADEKKDEFKSQQERSTSRTQLARVNLREKEVIVESEVSLPDAYLKNS